MRMPSHFSYFFLLKYKFIVENRTQCQRKTIATSSIFDILLFASTHKSFAESYAGELFKYQLQKEN